MKGDRYSDLYKQDSDSMVIGKVDTTTAAVEDDPDEMQIGRTDTTTTAYPVDSNRSVKMTFSDEEIPDTHNQINASTNNANENSKVSKPSELYKDYFDAAKKIGRYARNGALGPYKYLLEEIDNGNLNKENIDVKHEENGFTLLMFAIQSGQLELVDRLLKEGANIEVMNKREETLADVFNKVRSSLITQYQIIDNLTEDQARQRLRDLEKLVPNPKAQTKISDISNLKEGGKVTGRGYL